jgi:hypothetical protein
MVHNMTDTRHIVFIGGVGGSGSRTLAEIFKQMNFNTGKGMIYHSSNDSLYPQQFINQYCEKYTKGEIELNDVHHNELKNALKQHIKSDISKFHQCIKNPRLMYFLPVLRQVFPACKTIHIVRDCRDMLCSQSNMINRDCAYMHRGILSGYPDFGMTVPPDLVVLFWAKTNMKCYNENHIDNRHMTVRYEDMCQNPVQTWNHICEHIYGQTIEYMPQYTSFIEDKSRRHQPGRYPGADAFDKYPEVKQAFELFGYS